MHPARVVFSPGHYTVMENIGSVTLKVVRGGDCTKHVVSVDYKTANGTAAAGADYEAQEGQWLALSI